MGPPGLRLKKRRLRGEARAGPGACGFRSLHSWALGLRETPGGRGEGGRGSPVAKDTGKRPVCGGRGVRGEDASAFGAGELVGAARDQAICVGIYFFSLSPPPFFLCIGEGDVSGRKSGVCHVLLSSLMIW